nr:MAG TPA: hypothetical protein [Caudoviricetes sp.]
MIQVEGHDVYIDIIVQGQSLTDDFIKANNIEVFAFRLALSAGFAAPVISFIMGGSNLAYFNKFKEVNVAQVCIGTSPNDMDWFTFEVVGRDIKVGPQEVKYILHAGGVLTRGNFNSMFLKDRADGVVHGKACKCLVDTWDKYMKTPVKNYMRYISKNGELDKSEVRDYRRNQQSMNYWLFDMFTHINVTPSFPLATINKDCELILKDFQTLKKDGPVHVFDFARHPMPDPKKNKVDPVSKVGSPLHRYTVDVIPYIGKPETVSYKTFANRFCGYKQLTGINTDTGKLETAGVSLHSDKEGWNLNTLATTLANENNPIEHKYMDTQSINLSADTSMEYWSTALHNKNHSANMSSVQTKLLVQGKYLRNLAVLDLVKVNTATDVKASGLHIVEALEMGFTLGTPFTTVVWLCRDNFNDVEGAKSKQSRLLSKSGVVVEPSKKAAIVNATRTSRRGLIHARNILDKTYLNEWEAHLMGMKTAALSNFGLFGTNIDLSSSQALAQSLRNQGNILANKLIDKFVAPPFNYTLYNFLTGGAAKVNLLFSLISAILGADIYGEFNGLVSDLLTFDQFLDTYNKTLSVTTGQTAVSDSGSTQPESTNTTTVSFTENADGSINYNTESNGDTTVPDTEDKKQVVSDIIDEIKDNIPGSVDLPIPDVDITDSDIVKPKDDIKGEVIDKVIDDLINRGYVYDSDIVDNAGTTTVYVIKADGSVITGSEAKKDMLSSDVLKDILSGNRTFDTVSAAKVARAVGSDLKIRHWGTFSNEDELLGFIITQGFSDKYRTINCIKRVSAKAGKRIFVALPTSEKAVKFYINSERVIMNEMELEDIGYFTSAGKPIPYTIYYTTDGYNSNSVTLELRKEI